MDYLQFLGNPSILNPNNIHLFIVFRISWIWLHLLHTVSLNVLLLLILKNFSSPRLLTSWCNILKTWSWKKFWMKLIKRVGSCTYHKNSGSTERATSVGRNPVKTSIFIYDRIFVWKYLRMSSKNMVLMSREMCLQNNPYFAKQLC